MTHPAIVNRYQGTKRALIVAVGLIRDHELPEGHVHVHDGGACLTFDYTGNVEAARDVRYAAACLALRVEEHPSETPDGCAATEYRAQDLTDGILLTVRATVPVRALWPVSP